MLCILVTNKVRGELSSSKLLPYGNEDPGYQSLSFSPVKSQKSGLHKKENLFLKKCYQPSKMANTPEFKRSCLWTVFDHGLPGMVMEPTQTELCMGKGRGLVGRGIWASSVCSVAPGKRSMRKNESRKGIQNLPWPLVDTLRPASESRAEE